jgi:serine protease Do
MKSRFFVLLTFMISVIGNAWAEPNKSLPDAIKEVKPSIVAIAVFTPLIGKTPAILGTGFIVSDGKHIITNYHVVAKELDERVVQHYVALVGTGPKPQVLKMTLLETDPVHDLALLSIDTPLKPLKLANSALIDEGSSIFFTGFPIGAVLGLYPATHTGTIAAITPDINPARDAKQLSSTMLARLEKPFLIYQLDATAYPGNSGSPVFDRRSGKVIAVINKVFISQGKEAALTHPSGISYAVPIKYAHALAKRRNIKL